MRRRAPHDSCGYRSSRSAWECSSRRSASSRGRRASGTACDAERRTIIGLSVQTDAERRTIVEVIVPHAPAWECRSRRSASLRGRRASGKACDAERRTIIGLSVQTDAERRTIVAMIVPHAPAWECSSRRSASSRGRRASGKACDAERRTIIGLSVQTDAERRTIVAVIVPHATPAWECSSRRSASSRGRRASGKACDAERRTIIGLSVQTDAERRTIVGIIVPATGLSSVSVRPQALLFFAPCERQALFSAMFRGLHDGHR